jgi:hypothetical protein
VIHRDVSPSNILISARGDVKLTDFGVAKAARRLSVTSADMLKGKLGYMAPEQARGQAVPASDLFSLGAVLYEMLSGQRIRRGGDVDTVRHGSILPLRQVARSELPVGLERLVTGCLAPTLGERPATAAALREGLLKEHFAIQAASGQPLDSHRRMEDFLAEQLGRPRANALPGEPESDREKRLARAILEQVDGEELDGGRSLTQPPATVTLDRADSGGVAAVGAASVDQPPHPLAGELTTPDESLTTPVGLAHQPATLILDRAMPPRRPRSRRGGAALLVVGAVLVLVGAGLVVGVWVRRGDGPGQVASPDAAVRASLAPDAARHEAHPDARADLRVRTDLWSRGAVDLRALEVRPTPIAGSDRRPSSLWVLARIAGRVVWADIYVDGKRVGQSPLRIPRLPPGGHLVEARRDGYSAAARRARLKAGQELKVFLDLNPR